MSIDCTEGIEGTVDYQAGVENLKKVAADNYYYEFVPSRPELKDVEKKIVLMVLSAEWSEDGPTNYDALNKIAPGGYWTAHPKEMTEYEVSYIRGVQAWYWHVDLNTEEVTYLRSDE